jgi:acetyltransferase-like isoleucine patch superfamily enzyme
METEKKFFVHSNALCESENIGKDTRIWAFAHVLKGARIGENCNLCDGVFVENDVEIGNNVTIKNGIAIWDGLRIEDDVFLGPNCVLTNDLYPRSKAYHKFSNTYIRKGATIGANATIICGITIGRYALVGAGSVVTKDVDDFELVVGNPAKHRAWISKKGEKLIFESNTATDPEGNKYYLSVDKYGKETVKENL